MVLHLKSLFVAFKTKAGVRDGTDASLFLVVNTNGKDVLYQELGQLCPKKPANFADKSYANYFVVDLSTNEELKIDDTTYFRLAIGTRSGWTCYYADSWSPKTVFIWGEDFDGNIVPLAFQRDANIDLAKTNSSPVSIAIPRAAPCPKNQLLSDVLIIVLTSDGTWDPISVLLQSNAHTSYTHLDIPLSDPAQWDTKTGVTNLYFPHLERQRRFTPQALSNGRIVFRKKSGKDRWEPNFVYLFGVRETVEGTSEVIEILSVPQWKHGGLNTDRPEITIGLSKPAPA